MVQIFYLGVRILIHLYARVKPDTMSLTTEGKENVLMGLVDHAAIHFVLEKKTLIVQLFNGNMYSSSKMCFLVDKWIVITSNNTAFNLFLLPCLNILGAVLNTH